VKQLSTTALALIVAVAVAGAALAGTSAKKKPMPFLATFTGTATTQTTDSTVAITANGTGKGTGLGAAKITGTGTGDSSKQPCVPFTGTGSMTGAKGTLAFKVTPSSGCGDEQGQIFSVSGHAVVLKGTGKTLTKAKGTLKMSGTYDRSSGAFSVKFAGTLTK
jgi:hypothetical protein